MAIDREKVLQAAQKFVEKKKYDKAVLEYQKLTQEDPNDARTLLKIGDLQSKMEAYADAVATYERVGRFYAHQGFALKAIAVYKQIREIIAKQVPQLEERYGHIAPKLAELYQQLGLTSDALSALDEVATRFQRQGRDPEAIDVFRRIVELDPTNPLPHLRLAEAFSRVRDVDGAVSEFGVAAGQLVKLGRRDDALKVIERLLHHKADASHARIAAELYLARAQPNDGMLALAKLQLCFQANPKDLDTLALLARAFNAIGQAAKAVEVQKEMARIAKEQGKTELFKQLAEKLLRLAPNDEAVRQLVMPTAPPPAMESSEPPPPDRAAEVARSDLSYEHDLDSAEIQPHEIAGHEEDEQPIELSRRSQPPRAEYELEDTASVTGSDVAVAPAFEAAEEVGGGGVAADDVEAQISRILADAASFRRARFHGKAVETLRIGLEIVPRSLELRECLRDVFLEAGAPADAVVEMLNIASLQIDALDGDAAAQTLQEVLSLEPDNVRAVEMLGELGYELVEEAAPAIHDEREYYPQPELTPMRSLAASGSYDPEAPLPSYDLEDSGAEEARYTERARALSQAGPTPVPEPSAATKSLEDIDDPFGDGPLPSFPLPPESEAQFDLVHTRQEAYEEGTSRDALAGVRARMLVEDATSETDLGEVAHGRVAANTQPVQAVSSPAPELEDALEEAEFFATRGLFEDARTILEENLGRFPNHPLILERMQELDAHERSMKGGSGTREMPRKGPSLAPAGPVDRSFDIAASLSALDELPQAGRPSRPQMGDQQVDVEEVFAKFKEGVAKQISVDDAQSHYDLGVAYKEMGLLEDAIREFDIAARDPKRECICLSMIGTIQVERGNLNDAVEAYLRGLDAKLRTSEQETVLSFEVGACYEAMRMGKEALQFFQRVARRDPNHRDVQERIRRLQKVETKPPVRAAAVGADDEFDRAFDDIFGGGKLP